MHIHTHTRTATSVWHCNNLNGETGSVWGGGGWILITLSHNFTNCLFIGERRAEHRARWVFEAWAFIYYSFLVKLNKKKNTTHKKGGSRGGGWVDTNSTIEEVEKTEIGNISYYQSSRSVTSKQIIEKHSTIKNDLFSFKIYFFWNINYNKKIFILILASSVVLKTVLQMDKGIFLNSKSIKTKWLFVSTTYV